MGHCKIDYCSAYGNNNASLTKNREVSICNAFAAMAAECSEHFINVEWRRPDRCRKFCFLIKTFV